MEKGHLKFLPMCVCFLLAQTTKGVYGQCSTPPINQAVREGIRNVVMRCNSPTKIAWTFKPITDEKLNYSLTNYDDAIVPVYKNLFGVNQTGLIIKTAQVNGTATTIPTAGLYVAQAKGATVKYGAKLIVVHNGPECSCLPEKSTSNIQLSCTVTYAESIASPTPVIFAWTVNGFAYSTDEPYRDRMDLYVFAATSTITVDGSTLNSYQCTLTFGQPRHITNAFMAKNAPEFSASCSKPVCSSRNNQTTVITPMTRLSTATTMSSKTKGMVPTTSPTPVSRYCFPNMINMAVREGELDVLMNVTASSCSVSWLAHLTSNEFDVNQIVAPNCTGDPSLADLVYVNRSGLIIRNATTREYGHRTSTAGLYIAECNHTGNKTGAKLLVVRSGPECSCVPDNTSSNVTLSCSVDYADYTLHPIPAIMTWIVNGKIYSKNQPDRAKLDLRVYTATSNITVDGSTVHDYQCILSFGKPADDFSKFPYIATNVPEFNESCSTPVCTNVRHGTATTAPTTQTTNAKATATIVPCKAPLANIVVYEGTLSTFIDFPANPNGVKWSTQATTDELTDVVIVNNDNIVGASYAADYAISPNGLTIKNATATAESGHLLSTAGLYTVECGGDRRSFKVLVVREGPTCRKKLSPDSNSVEITCRTVYADSTYDPIAAIFTLYVDGKPNATDTPQGTKLDAFTWVSTSTFKTTYLKSSTYECVQTFGQPTEVQDPVVAMNAPIFNHACSA